MYYLYFIVFFLCVYKVRNYVGRNVRLDQYAIGLARVMDVKDFEKRKKGIINYVKKRKKSKYYLKCLKNIEHYGGRWALDEWQKFHKKALILVIQK